MIEDMCSFPFNQELKFNGTQKFDADFNFYKFPTDYLIRQNDERHLMR